MSLKDRLFNVAKAEAQSVADRFRRKAENLFENPKSPSIDPDYETIRKEVEAEVNGDNYKRRRTRSAAVEALMDQEPAEIRKYYANLELPIGAPLDEVKAAYRRLMRRYHPDKHQTDSAAADAATALSRELRTAYEGLTKYLSPAS